MPLNLLISFITLATSLVVRGHTLSLAAVVPHSQEVIALGLGGILGAAAAPRFLVRLADHHLERTLAVLLAAIGLLLMIEAFLPTTTERLIPNSLAWTVVSALALGIVIGMVASLLGVAGGELLIPTLVLLFTVDIRTAGTASLMISLVMVTSGLIRYFLLRAFPDSKMIRETAVPMGTGSIVGAAVGGFLVAFVEPSVLKVILGATLIAASAKTLWPRRA